MRRFLIEGSFIITGLMAALVLIIVVLCFIAVRCYNVESACLAAGYPRSSFTFTQAYCIKTVNQTDVVTELK